MPPHWSGDMMPPHWSGDMLPPHLSCDMLPYLVFFRVFSGYSSLSGRYGDIMIDSCYPGAFSFSCPISNINNLFGGSG